MCLCVECADGSKYRVVQRFSKLGCVQGKMQGEGGWAVKGQLGGGCEGKGRRGRQKQLSRKGRGPEGQGVAASNSLQNR